MSRASWPARAAALAAFGVAMALPFLLSPYDVSQLTLVWIYAGVILGLNLLTGYAGQISLAHGAFFGLGAYTAAICIDRDVAPPLATLPLSAAITAAAGVVLGFPALRVRGLYLALVTLGVALALPSLLKHISGLTGGAAGLVVDPWGAPAWSGLADDQALYFLALASTLLTFFLLRRLVAGPLGRGLRALRDNETAALTLGIDIARLKIEMFAVSAACAGLAGGVYTLAVGFVAPETFSLTLAFALVTAMVVGGSATLLGAFVGAAFIQYVPTLASDVNQSTTSLVYGVVLLACVYVLPAGVVGTAARLGRRLTGLAGPHNPSPAPGGRRLAHRWLAGRRAEGGRQ